MIKHQNTNLAFPKFDRAALERYRGDPVAFIEEQCVIRNAMDGGRSWVRPVLTPLQREVVNDVLTTRDKSGDSLYTTMLLSWARKMGRPSWRR